MIRVKIQQVKARRGQESVGAVIVEDITAGKRAKAPRRSEADLAEAQRLSHTGSWVWNVFSGEVFWLRELFRISA